MKHLSNQQVLYIYCYNMHMTPSAWHTAYLNISEYQGPHNLRFVHQAVKTCTWFN